MSINFHAALGIHADALEMRSERTRVLATNIANENTPGYQAQDLDFNAMLQQESAAGDSGANPAEAALSFDSGAQTLYRVPYSPSRDGNTVEIGVEQAAFAQNATDFQTTLTFLNGNLKGLSQAIAGE